MGMDDDDDDNDDGGKTEKTVPGQKTHVPYIKLVCIQTDHPQ